MTACNAIAPLIIIALSTACAKQAGSDDNGDSATASGGSIFHTSGGSGTSSTTGATGTTIGPDGIHYAEEGTDGLAVTDKATADALMSDPVGACSGWTAEPETAGTVLEFIVDVSGSMLRTSPTSNGATKWAVTSQALKSAIGQLPTSGVAVGMTFFPNMPISPSDFPRATNACVDTKDDVAIAQTNAAQKQALTSAISRIQVSIMGATPTHDAITIALADLKAATDPGGKYLVLITDGQPTQSLGCVGTGMTCTPEPTAPIVDAITAAYRNDQIKTFIVGSPGSEKNDCTNADDRAWLSAASVAGGTATPGCSDAGNPFCHFDLSSEPDFGKALSASLDSIIQGVISCEYDVPPPPAGETIDTAKVNLIYRAGDGSYYLILPSNLDTCTAGWHFTDGSKQRLALCSETCKKLQADTTAQVSLLFGCAQIPITTLQ